MFATTARSPAESVPTPGPKNSTKRLARSTWRSRWVTASARSVANTPSRIPPVSRTPTTPGTRSITGAPSIAASASSPPTPQASTPIPLTIGVWLSVPISVSGISQFSPSRRSTETTVDRRSRLSVCMMPVPGGWTVRLSIAWLAHFIRRKRSVLRVASRARLRRIESGVPKWSTAIEWSVETSTRITGSSARGSPPAAATPSRAAARSTRAGTQVVSCIMIRDG
jgi:hypothetical protein